MTSRDHNQAGKLDKAMRGCFYVICGVLENRWAGASAKPPPTCDWQSCEFLSASGLKSRFCYFDDVSMVFSTECFTGTGRKGSRPAQIEVVCEIG